MIKKGHCLIKAVWIQSVFGEARARLDLFDHHASAN